MSDPIDDLLKFAANPGRMTLEDLAKAAREGGDPGDAAFHGVFAHTLSLMLELMLEDHAVSANKRDGLEAVGVRLRLSQAVEVIKAAMGGAIMAGLRLSFVIGQFDQKELGILRMMVSEVEDAVRRSAKHIETEGMAGTNADVALHFAEYMRGIASNGGADVG